ncbi:MAG: hypothetical protein HY819_14865 [Acidobacteria bacterium]|nr:hypothetical protein [Acidobacteriota bacterium]
MSDSANLTTLPHIRNYLTNYKLLSSVNDIFTSFDEYHKIRGDLNFDLSLLESDVYTSLANPDKEKVEEIKVRLTFWRQVLEKFDSETSVGKLRHYFEEVGISSLPMLEHLLIFYLTKPIKSTEERDKVDLVVTRLGRMSFYDRENEMLLLPAKELKNHLDKVFNELRLEILSSDDLQEDIKIIEIERKKLVTIRSLREMLEKQVLMKLRKIKMDLGDKFFQPSILTEVVALNISLHNVFQDLFLAEQSRLTSFLQSQENTSIQVVTTAEEVLATVIERPNKSEESPNTTAKKPEEVSLNRGEIMEIINGMRSVLLMLDQHLQLLSDKLDS